MKFDFFKKKDKTKTSCDCACGCKDQARDSVRLTDAEIAEDVLCDLEQLCHAYDCLCREGCDCEQKLCSCEKTKARLCEYTQKI
ncbi:MAG: hypothetical protein HFE46_04840 [Clostridia bacterium]|nr:hypothetical protein [Clostridia bacterium]